MRHKWIALPVVASLGIMLLMPTLAWARPLTQGAGPELLTNPGFEGPMWFKSQCCDSNGLPINEVQVAEGWRAWWVQIPPSYIEKPANCEAKNVDYGCYWARPEFVDSARTMDARRIHSGNNSQKYFTFGRMHQAGLYQRVTGIVSGTLLHFSVHMMAWQCVDDSACNNGAHSDQPTTMHMKVGIDPTGGTNPFSPDIVWSREVDSFDHWTQYSIEAVAAGDAVTVFTHSRPEWPAPRLHNDVYVDDASLTAVGTPEPTKPAPGGGNVPAAAPAAAPAPAQPQDQTFVVKPQQNKRPDGSVVHIVQPNDTLFGMALTYGVTVDEIMRLNNLQPGQFLQIGQELIIKGAPASAPPTPKPTAAAPPQPAAKAATSAPQPAPVAAAPSASSGLCIQAFNDRNNNRVYDANEELAASVKFTVWAGNNQVATYTTNGVDEPHCFTGLSARAYTVRVEPPKNSVATTDDQIGVALAAGQTANVSFGVQLPGGKGATPGNSSASTGSSNPLARYSGAFLGVCGLGVLLAAGAIGFAFVSRRR